MSREEAFKILIAQGYCSVGKELSCEDCPCSHTDTDLCLSTEEIVEAVRILEKEL